MSIPRFSAIYALCVGALMILMWAVFLLTGQVPELQERPAEISLHLVAEFATAILLLLGGISTLRRKQQGKPLLLFALGMLLYTVIVSPGYYLQRGEAAFVVMFAVLLVLTIAAVLQAIRSFSRISKGGQHVS